MRAKDAPWTAIVIVFVCAATVGATIFVFGSKYPTEIAAIASAVYTLLTAILVVFVTLQLRETQRSVTETQRSVSEMKRATTLTGVLGLLKELNSPENVRLHRTIYNAYCENPGQFTQPETLPEDLQSACDRLVRAYGDLGDFVRYGLVDDGIVKEWLNVGPARLWKMMKEYIRLSERQRGNHFHTFGIKFLAKLSADCWFELQEHYQKTHNHLKADALAIFWRTAEPILISADELRAIQSELSKELGHYHLKAIYEKAA